MSLQLPTVTVEGLRAFHTKHFAHAPAPEHILHGVDHYGEQEEAEVEAEEEEVGLGYYHDGVQRTLTDEQIAVLRHSEIQRIIRERRRRRDNGEPFGDGEATSGHHSPAQVDIDPEAPFDGKLPEPVAAAAQPGRTEQTKPQQWATSSERTKARNKRNRNRYKTKKRDARLQREQTSKNKDAGESDEWDPWHQATGPDAQQDDTVDLDY